MPGGCVAERPRELDVARAEDRELHPERLELGDQRQQQVDALLLREAGHRDGERPGPLGKAQPVEERRSRDASSPTGRRRRTGAGRERVARRVPDVRIDAVADPDERVAPLAQKGVEAGTRLRTEHLLAVRRADDDDDVGEGDPARERIARTVSGERGCRGARAARSTRAPSEPW